MRAFRAIPGPTGRLDISQPQCGWKQPHNLMRPERDAGFRALADRFGSFLNFILQPLNAPAHESGNQEAFQK